GPVRRLTRQPILDTADCDSARAAVACRNPRHSVQNRHQQCLTVRGGVMADRMFEDVVSPPVAVGGRPSYSLPLSIGVHAALVAFVVVLPLVAPGALPVPATILAFVVPPALPLPSMPAPISAQPASRSADSSAAPLAPDS